MTHSILINPILFCIGHPFSAGDFPSRPCLIKRTGLWTITECFLSILLLTGIPLVNNHLNRHSAAPYAVSALGFVSPSIKPPMSSLPIRWQLWTNTKPWRRLLMLFLSTFQKFKLADLVELDNLCTCQAAVGHPAMYIHLLEKQALTISASQLAFSASKCYNSAVGFQYSSI